MSKYDSKVLLDQYLLFHYGEAQDLLPFPFGPIESINFPEKCVTKSLEKIEMPQKGLAIDVGCAVGRSSFELSKYFQKVIGIDSSKLFIETAKQLQNGQEVEYQILQEGLVQEKRFAKKPMTASSDKVLFQQLDANQGLRYPCDLLLAANVLCRLAKPKEFLRKACSTIKSGGYLILASPYSWSEAYTPIGEWIQPASTLTTLDRLKQLLIPLELLDYFELPFLLREHYRKYEWGVSQVSIWKKPMKFD